VGEDRNRILDLLATGKITAEDAGRLMDALGAQPAPADVPAPTAPSAPAKFMYVKVVSEEDGNVNVKIPLSLVRAGLKLTSLIPAQAMDQINKSMAGHGMSLDFSSVKLEDIEDLIQALREMEVNVDGKNGDIVRVYCA
jgi:hypothetical protein